MPGTEVAGTAAEAEPPLIAGPTTKAESEKRPAKAATAMVHDVRDKTEDRAEHRAERVTRGGETGPVHDRS